VAIETNLNCTSRPSSCKSSSAIPGLRSLSTTRARNLKLYNIYYDTADLELHRLTMALRLRRAGNQFLQTLKGGGQVSAGCISAMSGKPPYFPSNLILNALKACGGELPHGVRNRLQPVFVTDFVRNVRLLKFEGAEIELAWTVA